MGDKKKRKRRHSSSSSSSSDSDSDSSNSDSSQSHGSQEKREKEDPKSRSIGPQIPEGIDLEDDPKDSFIGPVVPGALKSKLPGYKSGSDDDDCFGPMPFSGDADELEASAAADFERRAQKMKSKMLGEDKPEVTDREAWMTQLPPEVTKNFALAPRQFRKGAGAPAAGGDRSCWTDTPADKERKAKEAADGTGPKPIPSEPDAIPSLRDQRFAEQIDNSKSGRGESLLQMHRKKIEKAKKKADKKAKKKEKKEKKKRKKEKEKEKEKKKKKAKKTAPVERRPFDRDQDLQVNRLDDARRKALLKKSCELGFKFGQGSQQFL